MTRPCIWWMVSVPLASVSPVSSIRSSSVQEKQQLIMKQRHYWWARTIVVAVRKRRVNWFGLSRLKWQLSASIRTVKVKTRLN